MAYLKHVEKIKSADVEFAILQDPSRQEFLVSVVVPVFNAGKFVKDAIESILNQSIGFLENIQLILVDNASTDDSLSICQDYAYRYPDNITLLSTKTNDGPGGARNAGLDHVRGKYLSFLDSDDKWESDAYEVLVKELNKYSEAVFITARRNIFGREEGHSAFDNAFKKPGLVDVFEPSFKVTLYATSCVYIWDKVRDYRFDERTHFGEDTEYTANIVLDYMKFVLCDQTHYLYRKPEDSSSLIDRQNIYYEYYFDDFGKFKRLIDKSLSKYGYVIPYVQIVTYYCISWHIRARNPLTGELQKKYKELVSALMQYVEDYVIIDLPVPKYYIEHKFCALALKYGRKIDNELEYRGSGNFYWKNFKMFNMKDKSRCRVTQFDYNQGICTIKGIINQPALNNDINFYITTDSGLRASIKYYKMPASKTLAPFGDVIREQKFFVASIAIGESRSIEFHVTYENHDRMQRVTWERFTPLYASPFSFYESNGRIFSYKTDYCIGIQKTRRKTYLRMERKNLFRLLKARRFSCVFWRIIGDFCHFHKFKHKVWLFFDRIFEGNDNAQSLFEQYQRCKLYKNVKTYYVLDRHSQDESARQSCRPLVHYGSLKHKWLYLRASILYGSITNNYAFDIFKQNRKEMKGLLLFDCFHLQHGIVNQDMSESLHRYNKNHIAMTASTQQEAEGFLLYPYGYERKEILLTGLARLDKAFPIRKMQRGRRVVIAPTYREWLVGSSLDKELHKEIKPGFEKSQFFIFYNSLVNSPQLHKALKKYGYNLLLRLHPSFYNAAKYFQANEFCEISTGDARAYQECLKDTAILITDYSSIAFDYAFAHCPIVYTQFDREEFFNRHLYQDGYFNHENDGFGPVCYSLEDAVQKIIGILTGGVKMEQVYKDRVRSFFQFNDDKNCERIFDATLNIEQSRNRI